MTRTGKISTLTDSAGDYEQEIFECENPRRIIVGIHGNGVRRWDGEEFYYQVAEYYTDSVVVLVDQNQIQGDGCKLNNIGIMVSRNQKVINEVKSKHPDLEIWVVGHSMGCGVTALLDTSLVDGIIFVAPATGIAKNKYTERYGTDIINGKIITSSDGHIKNLSKEFIDSVWEIDWKDEYDKLISRFSPVHVFESGAEEVVGEERKELREMPFTSYKIIEDAKHNYSGYHSKELFSYIDKIL